MSLPYRIQLLDYLRTNEDTHTVTWVYFNPDGNDGDGQFCILLIDSECYENSKTGRIEDFFNNICGNAEQTLADNGTPEFDGWLQAFVSFDPNDKHFTCKSRKQFMNYLVNYLRTVFDGENAKASDPVLELITGNLEYFLFGNRTHTMLNSDGFEHGLTECVKLIGHTAFVVKDDYDNKYRITVTREDSHSAETTYNRLVELLANAFEWATNKSNTTLRDLAKATGITFEELDAIESCGHNARTADE